MLQQKEISKLLAQVLETRNEAPGVFLASLLSRKGLPLVTVSNPGPAGLIVAELPDNLRIYSLLAVNLFKQQKRTGDEAADLWIGLDMDASTKVVVSKFYTKDSADTDYAALYVALFYAAGYPDSQARARLLLLTEALATGLRGYRST